MARASDINRTLDELDPPAWGEPEYSSHLVTTCHRLRKKPIGTFSAEDLRIMIGQNIGLTHLVPLALSLLENDPLTQGDYFRGDLLSNVLSAEPKFWAEHRKLRQRMAAILETHAEAIQSVSDAALKQKIRRFSEPE